MRDNIAYEQYNMQERWTIIQLDVFVAWLEGQPVDLQDEALSKIGMLEQFGPTLGRPTADTVKGSRLTNLKEMEQRKKQVQQHKRRMGR